MPLALGLGLGLVGGCRPALQHSLASRPQSPVCSTITSMTSPSSISSSPGVCVSRIRSPSNKKRTEFIATPWRWQKAFISFESAVFFLHLKKISLPSCVTTFRLIASSVDGFFSSSDASHVSGWTPSPAPTDGYAADTPPAADAPARVLLDVSAAAPEAFEATTDPVCLELNLVDEDGHTGIQIAAANGYQASLDEMKDVVWCPRCQYPAMLQEEGFVENMQKAFAELGASGIGPKGERASWRPETIRRAGKHTHTHTHTLV